MSKKPDEFKVRRILVALDASPHSEAALETAIVLAARMSAEVMAVFVQDADLIKLASFPKVQVTHSWSSLPEKLTPEAMEKALKVRAEKARKSVASLAEQARVRYSFRAIFGQVTAELLSAGSESDLLTLGTASWSVTRRTRLGSTALALARKSGRSILLMPRGKSLGGPLLLVYEGKHSQRALNASARLCRDSETDLVVLIPEESEEKAGKLELEARRLLEPWSVSTFYGHLRPSVRSLLESVQKLSSAVLVLSASSPLLEGKSLEDLLTRIDNPILLVR